MRTTENEQTESYSFTDPNKPVTALSGSQTTLLLVAAALGYISAGYHLSIYNSISTFIWFSMDIRYEFYTFQNICDTTLAVGVFVVALFVSFNKINYSDYKSIFKIADVIMIAGTLFSFGVISLNPSFVFFGRFLCAEAIGLNITCFLTFAREAQSYTPHSEFKTENRIFLKEVAFALGIFLANLFPQLIPEFENYHTYAKEINGVLVNFSQKEYFALALFCSVPICASLARMALLWIIGDIRTPEYAPAFNDEGLCENEEDGNQRGALYMIKFRETKSLMKLFKHPYLNRINLGSFLYFLQITTGWILFLVNPALVGTHLETHSDDDSPIALSVSFQYAVVYLIITLLINILFCKRKIARKPIMYCGIGFGILLSFGLLGFLFASNQAILQILMLLYWICMSLGLTSVVELYIDELLPSKGVQFLQSIKWFLITGTGIIIRTTLNSHLAFVICFLYFFGMTLVGVFVVYELTLETVGLSRQEINESFELEEYPKERKNLSFVRASFENPDEKESNSARHEEKKEDNESDRRI